MLQKSNKRSKRKAVQNQPSFILAWGHKTASELWFELKGRPPVVAQTALGKKALAYDFWFDPAPLLGEGCPFCLEFF